MGKPAGPVETGAIPLLEVQQWHLAKGGNIAKIEFGGQRWSGDRDQPFGTKGHRLQISPVDGAERNPEISIVAAHFAVGVGGEHA